MRITQIILNLILAILFFTIGALTLISPDVPAGAATENAIVGITLLGTAAVLIADLFWPFSGGLLLLASALAIAVVLNGFHLSEFLLTTRQVGYHWIWSALTLLLAALGVFSITRARRERDGDRRAPA